MSSRRKRPRIRRATQQATRRTRPLNKRQLVSELTLVALKLESIRATASTVQVALEGQMADSDDDFACCLRVNVSDQISVASEKIADLIVRLGGPLPEPLR